VSQLWLRHSAVPLTTAACSGFVFDWSLLPSTSNWRQQNVLLLGRIFCCGLGRPAYENYLEMALGSSNAGQLIAIAY